MAGGRFFHQPAVAELKAVLLWMDRFRGWRILDGGGLEKAAAVGKRWWEGFSPICNIP